ncbi:MAG TPA: amino acid adenylation domain-containing protein [Planctomycetes bacterium]|nr:amino acid adenylation domain-containing protein [Planctomycetota bacterium]HIK62184.1 amino acid adenylation domain-containing protein [Planctomycetota bacterium]
MGSEGFPLSVQQRRLLGGVARGHESVAPAVCRVKLSGKLQVEALHQALADVAGTYEILRTEIRAEGSDAELLQFIHEEGGVQEVTVRADLAGAIRARGWGLHFHLLAGSAGEHELHLGLPAATADAVSLTNLVTEIGLAYGERCAGREPAGDAMQYLDIAEWQGELLGAPESAPGRTYWADRDPTLGVDVELPFQLEAGAESALATFACSLDGDEAAAVAQAAQRAELDASSILFAAWVGLLRRMTLSSDVLVGVCVPGRGYEELEDPLGLLARTLPIGLDLSADPTFAELAKLASKTLAGAVAWQDCLQPEDLELPDRLPFGFEARPATAKTSAAEVEFSILERQAQAEPQRCHLLIQEQAAGFDCQWQYDGALFTPALIERLSGQYRALLRSAAADASTPLSQLEILSAAEWKQLIVDFNDSAADYPRGQCAHHWFEEYAQTTPDSTAVRQGDQVLTYAQLDARANQLAHQLQGMGVGPDIMVALCIDRSLDMVVSILGILKAGGAYVPVDPTYPTDRIQFIIEDTSAPVLVTQSRLASQFSGGTAQLLCMDGDRETLDARPTTAPACAATSDSLVYVIYTSGSTGKPKGVVITHEKLVISNNARMQAFGHCPEAFLLLSSVAFDSSVVGIFWSLCGGGSLLLMPEGLEKEIERIPAYIAEHSASHLLTLPSFYRHILEQCQPEQLLGMRAAIVAGEACPLKMVEHHRQLLPGVGLFSEYGATETTVFSSVYDCLEQTEPIAPLGDPIDNMQMYVLDEHLHPCPIGLPGEVHFGGPALAVEYLKRPELTAERFISNPFREGDAERLYKSGDLARFSEKGEMEFLGRLDNQVKIRGFRIELEEIEVALVKHAAVKEAAVLALADLGDEKRLVGYIFFEESQKASIGELREFLLETLPDFMLPAVFVFLEDMPRTPNGKVDRKALPEPGSERPELESQFAAPASAAELGLAGIWVDVLGIEKVGVNDNFFELGGDSILSIQVVSRAGQAGIKITPRQVFENQTIAELVAVADLDAAPAREEEQGAVQGPVRLTPVQHWYFDLNLPRPQYWNMPILLELRGDVDAGHLQQALEALVSHHDALRTRFVQEGGEWKQRVELDQPGELLVREDLSSLAPEQQAEAFEALAARHQAALDLNQGPILRAVLVQRGHGQPDRLLWIVHHLVIDGVSWRILLEDLENALDQIERGESVALQSKSTSFQRWSECLTEYANTSELAQEARFWSHLAGADIAELPIDHPGGANLESSARRVRTSLSQDLTRSLLSEVPRAYNTQINDVLLTALSHAFANWMGGPSVLFTLEGHGRQEIPAEVDLSRTVGWFTSDYPVLLKPISGEFDPGASLQATKQQLTAIPSQGFSHGLGRYLCRDEELRDELAALPTPVIGFNYLGQFDQLFGADARFGYCDEPFGPALGPNGNRIFVLEVYGRVSQGKLEFDFEYSENLHDAKTIEALAEDFSSNLEALIHHCIATDAGELDTSEFSEFDWSASDLSSIMDAISDSQNPGGAEA